VAAHAYAVLDRNCGDVIAVKNPNERMPPASLTKIVTALVVRNRANLDDVVLVNVSGKRMAAKGSSVMGIEPGMLLSVRDLLNGLFLASGNDAAEALAQYVSGNDDAFVALMNQAARQLRMADSHFSNPHGLDDSGLYSTALDMAVAGSALLNDPVLAQISSAPEYLPDWKGGVLKNGNRLLQSYPGAFGVKIGFTEKAHQTLVAAAERDGRQLIVSLLKTDDRYTDAEALLDWAFANSKATC
jgi:D-alanyl-D-alanine carboxypeptidase